jgi:hypothetical protein
MLEQVNLAVEQKEMEEVCLIVGPVKEYLVKHQKHLVKCLHLKKQKRLEKRKAWANRKASHEE